MPRRHVANLGLARGAPKGRNASYPRPLLERSDWTSLDGVWDFALDPAGSLSLPEAVRFQARIEVPFAPETPRSGIADTGLYRACWYRRELVVRDAPSVDEGRLLLHFGAVDYEATVWIDGELVTRHEGGYTPFTADVTEVLADGHAHELTVRAEDEPSDLAKPRGKQDWQLEPHSIWYPRTTGIWQPVWLERVPRARVASLAWTPHLSAWEIAMHALVTAPPGERYWLSVRLHVGDVIFAEDRYAVVAGEVHRRIALSDPGIDDFRNEFLWSPASPTLIEVEVELASSDGATMEP